MSNNLRKFNGRGLAPQPRRALAHGGPLPLPGLGEELNGELPPAALPPSGDLAVQQHRRQDYPREVEDAGTPQSKCLPLSV